MAQSIGLASRVRTSSAAVGGRRDGVARAGAEVCSAEVVLGGPVDLQRGARAGRAEVAEVEARALPRLFWVPAQSIGLASRVKTSSAAR
jgi:hypothetical protein